MKKVPAEACETSYSSDLVSESRSPGPSSTGLTIQSSPVLGQATVEEISLKTKVLRWNMECPEEILPFVRAGKRKACWVEK